MERLPSEVLVAELVPSLDLYSQLMLRFTSKWLSKYMRVDRFYEVLGPNPCAVFPIHRPELELLLATVHSGYAATHFHYFAEELRSKRSLNLFEISYFVKELLSHNAVEAADWLVDQDAPIDLELTELASHAFHAGLSGDTTIVKRLEAAKSRIFVDASKSLNSIAMGALNGGHFDWFLALNPLRKEQLSHYDFFDNELLKACCLSALKYNNLKFLKQLVSTNREGVSAQLNSTAFNGPLSDEVHTYIRSLSPCRMIKNSNENKGREVWVDSGRPDFLQWVEENTRAIPFHISETLALLAMTQNLFDLADYMRKVERLDFFQSLIVKSASVAALDYATSRKLFAKPWDSACAMWAVMGPQFVYSRVSPYNALKWFLKHNIKLESSEDEDVLYQYMLRKGLSDNRVLLLCDDLGFTVDKSRCSPSDASQNGNYVGYLWMMKKPKYRNIPIEEAADNFVKVQSLEGLRICFDFKAERNERFPVHKVARWVASAGVDGNFNMVRLICERHAKEFAEALQTDSVRALAKEKQCLWNWMIRLSPSP